MADAFNEQTEYVTGSRTFDQVNEFAEVEVIGSSFDDEVELKSVLKKSKNGSPDDFTLYYNGMLGEDTLDYEHSGDQQSNTASVNMYVSDNSDYQYKIEGGYAPLLGRSLDSMTVYTKDVEVFQLTALSDFVNLSGATGGTDEVHGAAGNDTMSGSSYMDHLEGGNDSDLIKGWGGADYLVGDKGNDTIWGGYGADTIIGGSDDDRLFGATNSYNDTATDVFMFGDDDGNDTVYGFTKQDTLVFTDANGSGDLSLNNYGSYTEIGHGDTLVRLNSRGIDNEDWAFNKTSRGLELTWEENASPGTSEDTVICTYMHERGFISDAVYKWDGVYGRHLGAEVLAGYHSWAIPLVDKVLKRSELATQLVRPLACAWAMEMAHRCDPQNHPQGSRLGQVLLTLGVPVCRVIGCSKRGRTTVFNS